MKRLAVVLLSAAISGPALADQSLEAALSEIEGREVSVTGAISLTGTSGGDPLYYDGNGTSFRLDFALSREDMKQAYECLEIDPWGSCSASFKAEITRSGASLGLLVYEIDLPLTPLQ